MPHCMLLHCLVLVHLVCGASFVLLLFPLCFTVCAPPPPPPCRVSWDTTFEPLQAPVVTSSGSSLFIHHIHMQTVPDLVVPGKFIGNFTVVRGNLCPGHCLNGGSCVAGVCRCALGYYGATCESRVCDGRAVVTTGSGSFRPDGNMAPFARHQPRAMFCWWLIQPNVTRGQQGIHMAIRFGGGSDIYAPHVVVFDGPDMMAPVLLNTEVRA